MILFFPLNESTAINLDDVSTVIVDNRLIRFKMKSGNELFSARYSSTQDARIDFKKIIDRMNESCIEVQTTVRAGGPL